MPSTAGRGNDEGERARRGFRLLHLIWSRPNPGAAQRIRGPRQALSVSEAQELTLRGARGAVPDVVKARDEVEEDSPLLPTFPRISS